MNERIQELSEQAKEYALKAMLEIADLEKALEVYMESFDTKFAQLIIQECCDVVRYIDAVDIKKHFGLDEQ
jgi:hypothetical protein